MKTKIKSKPAIDNQQALDAMLAEAMKQPGVAAAMQLIETAEKYSQPAKGYSAYIDWQRYPVLSTNCSLLQPA